MLKNGLTFLSIVGIASVLSGCLHATFPRAPAYRECGSAYDGTGAKIIYCEWMNANHEPQSVPRTEKALGQMLMIPLKDVPKIEKYEAEVKTWVDDHCK